jgi:hypothetical protein
MALCAGRLRRITVSTSSPNARYETTPTDVNRIVMKIILPVSTFGNFSGSFIDSAMGMTDKQFSELASKCGAGN